MSKELHFLPWEPKAYGSGHQGGENGETCHTEDAGDEDLLVLLVKGTHWKGKRNEKLSNCAHNKVSLQAHLSKVAVWDDK